MPHPASLISKLYATRAAHAVKPNNPGYMANNYAGHHPDHHRLPLHHLQAGHHRHLGCLQHLVRLQNRITRILERHADIVNYSAAPSPPVYPNGTAPAVPTTPVGTGGGSVPTTTGSSPETTAPVTAGAGKAVAMSGAGLAGVLGLAAFFL